MYAATPHLIGESLFVSHERASKQLHFRTEKRRSLLYSTRSTTTVSSEILTARRRLFSVVYTFAGTLRRSVYFTYPATFPYVKGAT